MGLGFTNSFAAAQPVVADGNGHFARRLHFEKMVANFLFEKELWPRNEKIEQQNQFGSEGRCNQENYMSLISISRYRSLRVAYVDEREETADA
ncbi:hypothetical protein IGI04_030050 [Brassica rapa subsp. trilocularis]|uniref:Uncharacterized protein n=1 Tax=Brassica rapa subsp. trilocularis TaxID=1813537 RepID=A0ABQ7LPP3_BRACM|nr:hypothetical protein IGI04_030050 [Brassica rapa subsp. trilocularis]